MTFEARLYGADETQALRPLMAPVLADPMTNSIISGAFTSFLEGPKADHRFLVVHEGQEMRLAGSLKPPFGFALSGDRNGEAARWLGAHAVREGLAIPTAVGELQTIEAFRKGWEEAGGRAVVRTMDLRLFGIDKVIPPHCVAGTFRLATAQDLDIVTAWTQAFAIDTGLPSGEATPEAAMTTARAKIASAMQGIWEVDGEAVSIASYRPVGPDGSRVSGVYTPPEHRGHGYASAVVAEVTKLIQSRGRWASLFTDEANPTSNSIYRKIGYRDHSRHRTIEFAG